MHFSQLSRSFRAKPSAHCKYISQPERTYLLARENLELGACARSIQEPYLPRVHLQLQKRQLRMRSPGPPARKTAGACAVVGREGGEAADTARARGVVAGGRHRPARGG